MRKAAQQDRRDGADGRLTWEDVDAARRAALAGTHLRWHAAVTAVYDAVKALSEAGTGARITVESVGDWCRKHRGGPTAQSVRNNPRLVNIVRIAAAVRSAVARPVGDRPVELSMLEQLGDPVLRSELEAMLAHRRSLIVENANLRAAAARIEAITFLSREMAEANIQTLEDLAAHIREQRGESGGPAFTPEEAVACRTMLDGGMVASGLAIDDTSGEIIDRVKRTVAGPGVVSVLRKVAASRPG